MEEYLNQLDKMDLYGEILDEFINNDGYIINELIEKEVRNMVLDPNMLNSRILKH